MNESVRQKDHGKSDRLRLYLMRHGETDAGRDGKLYGHTDAALSPAGIEQSRNLSNELQAIPLGAVYSSDLSRAVFAAQLIADSHGLTPRLLSGLREVNMGYWEASTLGEIAVAHPEMLSSLFVDPSMFRYPGGESFADFRTRIDQALRGIFAAHSDGEVAIVAHGGVCRVILGSLLELAPRNLLRLSQDFGCLNVVDVFGGQPLVRLLNYLPGKGCIPPW